MAFGNIRYFRHQETNGWRSEQVNGNYYAWYARMFEDEEFLQEYVDRWSELRSTVLATTNVLSLMDGFYQTIKPAAIRTIQRWFPPPDDKDPNRIPSRRFDLEVKQMRDWIRDRLDWIDSQGFPKPMVQVSRLDDAKTSHVSMACMTGRIFYTMNGSDPRARGGKLGIKAVQYAGPIDVTNEFVVTARVRSDFGLWSAPVRTRMPEDSK
jgi:hypothetical protein